MLEIESTETGAKKPLQTTTTAEYCAELQLWMWQYYCGYARWHRWVALLAVPVSFAPPATGAQTPAAAGPISDGGQQQVLDTRTWYSPTYPDPGSHQEQAESRTGRQHSPPQPGQEFKIPSALQRFLAETVDFFILFCVKATIVLWTMHLSGMKNIGKFISHFIVVEIDENTSMEDLRKMVVVVLLYRVLVCIYEIVCIWGAGGVTPGKFLLGLRVVTCDTSTLVQPSRVLVVPASNVSLSASTVRALSKNFSIAFLFPVFVTLLVFQHNRMVYDIVAGTIVVQHREGR
ncbi:protein FAM8A1 [Thalassophryne amazonica]|uniref:protein FAM8A1 n=1 Tax=Thalassophryne amazonica TaxID=390379 RepID=UPI001471306A|nr:protein FAM8A1 [Thalassophryne amazonica]